MFTGSAVRPELAKTSSSLAPSNPALCTVAHETIRRLKLPVDESAHTVPLALELEFAPFGQIDHHQQSDDTALSQIDRQRASRAFVLTDRKIARPFLRL